MRSTCPLPFQGWVFSDLTEAFYLGLQVTVNGASDAVFRVNGVLCGAFLPGGVHTIAFQFRPIPVYWGVGFAGLSLILTAAINIGSRLFQNGEQLLRALSIE